MIWSLPFIASLLFILQSVILKEYSKLIKRRQIASFDIHVTYSMLAACGLGLCWIISGAEFSLWSFWTSCGFGICFALTMICYELAMSEGVLAYSAFCFSASMVLPVILSALFWKEVFNPVQIIGVGLFLVSFYLIMIYGQRKSDGRLSRSWYVYATLTLLFNGLIPVFSKIQQTKMQGDQVFGFLSIGFFVAAICFLILKRLVPNVSDRATHFWKISTWLKIIMLGLAAGLGNALVTWLSWQLPGVYLFSAVSGSVIIGLTLISAILYRETLSPAGGLGVMIGVIAIFFVSW
ncbi:hypothetical protein [Lederbergia panacisoli]|uniref:hypothetical protein n=1 Tax=Lederbergia panacisoli TaxID=1255251 RepID=UPI00214C22D2|nr:hypothetical protein [Lederbergia panacisoli]MCR2823294.1 hypothetical protein [Lederbergia panacisoli]